VIRLWKFGAGGRFERRKRSGVFAAARGVTGLIARDPTSPAEEPLHGMLCVFCQPLVCDL
jgi:hypothetical protein